MIEKKKFITKIGLVTCLHFNAYNIKQILDDHYVTNLTNIEPSKKCLEVFHTTVDHSKQETRKVITKSDCHKLLQA